MRRIIIKNDYKIMYNILNIISNLTGQLRQRQRIQLSLTLDSSQCKCEGIDPGWQ